LLRRRGGRIRAMLTIYRRHLKKCAHRSKGRAYRHCTCPIWVDGFLAGVEIRQSLKMLDWQRANRHVQEWESTAMRPAEAAPKPLVEAWTEFLADLDARKLADSTARKYRLLRRQMEGFAAARGLRFLPEFDLAAAGEFRGTWKDGARSSAKKLERLRAFFRFAQRRKWVAENPATDLRAPKVTLCPTLPFTQEEMIKILAGTDKYLAEMPEHGKENGRRIRGLVLLLRYSGMRISDAVNLRSSQLDGNRLFLYTQKTGVPVNALLPDFVVKALEATARVNQECFFWRGVGKLDSAVRSWQTRLRRLFEMAEISGGHPHRFRDTFAVELLLTGVPVERVSVLLGHQSVRITERHYSPWVRSRQEQLEADLSNAWSRDPVLELQTKGTLQGHGRGRRIN
jgi:integrase/recombinase XerD